MEKECPICKKKSLTAWRIKKLRGKYNPTIKKRKYPNFQWVRVAIDIKKPAYKNFAGKRILACTKCIKAMGEKD